ncbi:MAG: DUF401 family protein [Spirochaetes bacterium]|nr:DUF401 family protein [Spirochaetota bacterium]
MHIPYIIRVLVSLLVILAAHKLFKKLWLAVLVGTLLLAFWIGHSPASLWAISWQRAVSLNNVLLMAIIFQVIWLSSQMSASGNMKEMVDNIRFLISKRFSMAILPAIIGLLPMPGGAIFSAPLLDDCDTDKQVRPILKTKINYWFRHIWEYWWPLYPGVLLAVDITGLPIVSFMMLQLPLSLLSVLAGYFFLLRQIKSSSRTKIVINRARITKIILAMTPIIVIMAVYFLMKMFLPVISGISKYLPMIIAIVIAQLVLQIQKPQSWETWKKILFSSKALVMVVIVLLIRIYGAFVEGRLTDGTFLMTHMRNELNTWQFPYILIIMFIPFISGLTTGVAIGFVGASFPVIMSLLGTDPGMKEILSTTVLAYASGYMGMILSPVHICLIVTNEHFKTSLTQSLIKLIKPVLVMIAGALIFYFLLRQ